MLATEAKHLLQRQSSGRLRDIKIAGNLLKALVVPSISNENRWGRCRVLQPSPALFSRQSLLINDAALHHKTDVGQHRNVLQWIARDGDDIGQIARFE